MKSALALLLLFASAYAVMVITRYRARLRTRGLTSLEDFNERVGEMIRCAGARKSTECSPVPQITDLLRIWRNSHLLQEEASHLSEMLGGWKDVAEKLYLQDIQIGLDNISATLTCKLLISALEIIFGKIRSHGHYLYTYAVAGTYCEMVDLVESMENILERDANAEALRRHLE